MRTSGCLSVRAILPTCCGCGSLHRRARCGADGRARSCAFRVRKRAAPQSRVFAGIESGRQHRADQGELSKGTCKNKPKPTSPSRRPSYVTFHLAPIYLLERSQYIHIHRRSSTSRPLFRCRARTAKSGPRSVGLTPSFPRSTPSHTPTGHCYLMQDDLQKAYAAYQQALYFLPNPKVRLSSLARSLPRC